MMKKCLSRLLTGTLCLGLVLSGTATFAMAAETATAQGTETLAQTVSPQETQAVTTADEQDAAIYEDPSALPEGQDAAAQSETDESSVQYVGTASVNIKVRRQADKSASGNGSITKDSLVYIIEYGDEWCLVDTGRNLGYVQTKYLTDIRKYSQSQGTTQTVEPNATAAPDASADSPANFQEKFKAYAYKPVVARVAMDDRSSAVFKVSKYEGVVVSSNQGDWSYIRYNNSYGYVPTSALFKWDRIDPYAGDIPGCIKHVGLAFVNSSADIRSYVDSSGDVLKTVNPGSALAVDAKDDQNRYPLSYWRTTGYVEESDVGYFMPVVPWEDAQSGDLISCMSTYYAVGIHTLQYQGRNWNIYLGSSFISGTILQPGEKVNIYDIMGPYRSSTGYHRAPIMAPGALWGYGGGTCQVNTTLYNALIQVPILVNWRKVHAEVGIYYCPVGFDAAVGGGDITMIFTNTLPYAFRINYFMSDGCLTVGIFKV